MGKSIRMLVNMHPEAKDEVYNCQVFFLTDSTSWELLRVRASEREDGVVRVSARNLQTIPFPDMSAASVCAAVEDRTGRMSNFVPVHRLDMCLGGSAGF